MSASEDTVVILNANTGRTDGRLSRRRYEAMKQALLKVIPKSQAGMAYQELSLAVEPHLPGWWFTEGWSVKWHVATVKLDLEARGLIGNVKGKRPMHVHRL